MRLLPVALVFLALAVSSASAQTAASDAPLTGTLAKVKERNRIVLGIRENIPPFSYLDDNQKVIGFSVDICMRIVDAVKQRLKLPGLEVEYAPVTSSSRLPLMTNGSVDLECGTTTNNADRQKQVAFSNTFFLSASRYLWRKSDGFTSSADLKGKNVSSVAGSTTIPLLMRANARGLALTVLSARDTAEGFLLLETGRAAAFAMDDVQLAIMAALSRDPKGYVLSDEALNDAEPYGIMLRRDDPDFKALVNQVTGDLFRSPQMQALYDRWFTQPTPPRGVNYNFPMPDTLRKAYAQPSDSPDPAVYAR